MAHSRHVHFLAKHRFRIIEMTCHLQVVAHFILMINLAGTFDLQPPRDVKIVRSELQWSPSSDDSVLYSVQYKRGSEKVDKWHNVLSQNGTKLEITNDFYKAIFRVRAEKGAHASEWQISDQVECVNLNFCIPLMTLNVKPGIACLYMTHMDRSLEKEYGVHIAFNISSWKVVNGGNSKIQFNITNSKTEVFRNLESWQKYCFRVHYSLYNKPYGNTSEQQCVIIPETPEEAKRRAWLTSMLPTLFVLTICGCCIFALFKNYKRIKEVLQPTPLISAHFLDFFSRELPQQPSPSSQSLQSCDMITLIENVNTEENGQERS